jgi:hypothetical protein
MLMAGTLDDILPSIVNAKDAGVTQARIKTKLAKRYHGQLQEKLRSLVLLCHKFRRCERAGIAV